MKRGWAGIKNAAIVGRNNNLIKKYRNKRLETEKCFTSQGKRWNLGRQVWIFIPRQREFKTVLPLQEDIKIWRRWIFRFFKSHHSKQSYLSSVNITVTHSTIDFVASLQEAKSCKKEVSGTDNAEICMTYQMLVFKTIEKHLGSIWLALCLLNEANVCSYENSFSWSFSWKLSTSFYHISYCLLILLAERDLISFKWF